MMQPRSNLLRTTAAFALLTLGAAWAKTDLRMTWWGSTERHELTNQVLELYQQEHPDVQIASEYTGWDGYWEKLATQVAGGNAPDLIQMDYRYLSEYVSRGTLLDLQPYVGDTINLDDFNEALLASGQVDGGLYGVSLGGNVQMLVANTAMLEEAGISLPETWSWEEFASVAQELSDALGEGVYGTMDGGGSEPWLELFLRQRGKQLYTEDGGLGYAPEDLSAWFSYWEELRASGAAPSADVTAMALGDVQNSLVVNGQAAVEFVWSNQFSASQALAADPLTAQLPPGEGDNLGLYFKPSMFISVAASTDAPEASAELVNFLVSDPEAGLILRTERGMPGSSSLLEALSAEADEVDQVIFDYLAESEPYQQEIPVPPPPGAGEIEGLLLRTNEQLAFGRLSVEEAVDRYFSEAQTLLEQAQ
jgi:multiple sugar transport system substrate-binding protein